MRSLVASTIVAALWFLTLFPGSGGADVLTNGNWDREVPFNVDLGKYLARHDIVYLSPPDGGFEGFPVGNGDIGAMVWTTDSAIQIQINKCDTWDEPSDESPMVLRSCGRLSVDFETPCFDWLYLDEFEGRLSLYNAQAHFAAKTPFVQIKSSSRVQADRNVFLIHGSVRGLGDLEQTGTRVRIGLERWGSRAFPGWYGGIARGARHGLGAAEAGVGDDTVWIDESFGKVSFAVACRVISDGELVAAQINERRCEISLPATASRDFTLLVSVVTSNESPEPRQAAIDLLNEAAKTESTELHKLHSRWWSDFWNRSFIHVDHDYLENLYYLHMYTMASASRGKYPAMFNAATFTWNRDVRQWVSPHHWNMQQAYWSLGAANHCELVEPYVSAHWNLVPQASEYAKSRGFDDAILFSEKYDMAGRMLEFPMVFTPASQIAMQYWDQYRFTGDRQLLSERAYPFMKKAAEFYLQYLKWNDTQRQFEIPGASIYECPQGDDFRNTITDLAMIRVLFPACIKASEILDIDQDKSQRWRFVLEHLPEYSLLSMPGTGEVLAVGQNPDGSIVDFKTEDEYTFCRNTAPVFPAGDIGLDDFGSSFFEASVRRAKLHPQHKLAISPIAAVKARLGMAEEARDDLLMSIRQLQHFPQGLFFNLDHWSYLSKSNKNFLASQRDYIYDRSLQYESVRVAGGGDSEEKVNTPTLPFAQCGLEPSGILAVTLNEMLLQSHESKIRVFPATPSDWTATFTLRARGGFLISSHKEKDAPPEFIVVHSLIGGTCRIASPWPSEGVSIREALSSDEVRKSFDETGLIVFHTTANGRYIIARSGHAIDWSDMPLFPGETNNGPKRFHEAILGKVRDF